MIYILHQTYHMIIIFLKEKLFRFYQV